MAPEVIAKGKYDAKADIWSLGISVIEMCEGSAPYKELDPKATMRAISEKAAPKLSNANKFSAELNDFISKCLTKNPNDRPDAMSLVLVINLLSLSQR